MAEDYRVLTRPDWHDALTSGDFEAAIICNAQELSCDDHGVLFLFSGLTQSRVTNGPREKFRRSGHPWRLEQENSFIEKGPRLPWLHSH